MKDETMQELQDLERGLKSLKSVLNASSGKFVNKKQVRDLTQAISNRWFSGIEKRVEHQFEIPNEVLNKYSSDFQYLWKLSRSPVARKPSYQKTIQRILQSFENDLIIPVLKSSTTPAKVSNLSNLLSHVNESEKQYLEEAIACANQNYFRAAVVLGWCAAIDRIQKVVEKKGLEEFTKKTLEMSKLNAGRFKRFGKVYSVKTKSDLQTVFDSDLLWVLEYWGLIDSNQHDRLAICFTMRNNSAHPGEALITEENLLSFFSDIDRFIFQNQNMKG